MQTADTSLVRAGRADGPLDQIVRLVLDSVTSENTKTAYRISLHDFMTWAGSRGLPFTKATVNSWRADLESRGFAPSTINARLSPVRKLAVEAADNGFMPPETAAAVGRVRGPSGREYDWAAGSPATRCGSCWRRPGRPRFAA